MRYGGCLQTSREDHGRSSLPPLCSAVQPGMGPGVSLLTLSRPIFPAFLNFVLILLLVLCGKMFVINPRPPAGPSSRAVGRERAGPCCLPQPASRLFSSLLFSPFLSSLLLLSSLFFSSCLLSSSSLLCSSLVSFLLLSQPLFLSSPFLFSLPLLLSSLLLLVLSSPLLTPLSSPPSSSSSSSSSSSPLCNSAAAAWSVLVCWCSHREACSDSVLCSLPSHHFYGCRFYHPAFVSAPRLLPNRTTHEQTRGPFFLVVVLPRSVFLLFPFFFSVPFLSLFSLSLLSLYYFPLSLLFFFLSSHSFTHTLTLSLSVSLAFSFLHAVSP